MQLRLHFLSIILFMTFVMLIVFQSISFSFISTSLSYQSPKKPVHVLIISSWRSGSSFIGQIFNHHDDVFYLFEPGHPVWMRLNRESAEILHYPVRDLFRSLFTCDVSPLYSYLPNGGQRISELKFFAESRALCQTPFCAASIPGEGYERNLCFHRCRNASLGKMEGLCRTYSHVVMKTVRIFNLNILLPLLQDPSLDLRILHFVRDPRAVSASRKYFSLTVDDRIVLGEESVIDSQKIKITLEQVMAKICNAQLAINKAANAAGESLRDRYMFLRYEDLALDPLENVKKIYNFTGLSLTPQQEKWIYNITHQDDLKTWGFMPYSRNANVVIQRWRKVLKFSNVQEIERLCKGAMAQFGYLPVKSPTDLHNLNVSLIEQRITKDKKDRPHRKSIEWK